jgi:gas vesicle structural protein
MAISTPSSGPSGGALTEVLELILDRGVVIDVFARVSLVGIEILTVDARIVVASVDTYLRYADAVGRLELDSSKLRAQDLIGGNKTEKAIEAAKDQLGELFAGLSQPAEQVGQRVEPVSRRVEPVSQRAEHSSRVPDGKRPIHRRPARRPEREDER